MKPYPEMKDSGGSWIGKVPAGWKIIKLKKVVTLSGEKTATQKSPYIGMENIVSWNGTYKLNTQIIPESICSVFHSGDILFGKLRPYLAKCVLMDLDGVCSGELLVLTNIKCNKSFLRYFLLNKYFIDVVNSSTYGAKMPRANWDFIGNQLIVLPPSDEQAQIVRYLDSMTAKINKLIRARKQQIELLKEQKQAVINQAVTRGLNHNVELKDSGLDWFGPIPKQWECARMKNLFSFITRGTTPDYIEDSSYTKVVNQATFSKGYWDEAQIRFTKVPPDIARGLLKQNDILLASTGGGVLGKVYFFIHNGTYIADSHVTILRSQRRDVLPKYFYFLFSIMYDFINAKLAKGSTNQTELQRDLLCALSVPFPNIETQNAIVDFLDKKCNAIDLLIRQYQKIIEQYVEYKQTLISAVVTGQVDVRNIAADVFSPDELAASCDPEEAEESDSPIPEEFAP